MVFEWGGRARWGYSLGTGSGTTSVFGEFVAEGVNSLELQRRIERSGRLAFEPGGWIESQNVSDELGSVKRIGNEEAIE